MSEAPKDIGITTEIFQDARGQILIKAEFKRGEEKLAWLVSPLDCLMFGNHLTHAAHQAMTAGSGE